MNIIDDDTEWKIWSVRWTSFISYPFAGFFIRQSILLISSGSRLLLLAVRSRLDGHLLFMFRLLCLTVILLVSDFEYLKILRCILIYRLERVLSGGGTAVFPQRAGG